MRTAQAARLNLPLFYDSGSAGATVFNGGYGNAPAVNNASQDPTFRVARTVNDASGTGYAHGYTEDSTFSRSPQAACVNTAPSFFAWTYTGNAPCAYAAYDDRQAMTGSVNFDHQVGYQSLQQTASFTGTLDRMVGFFFGPQINSGTVNHAIATYVADAAGAGTVANQYGLFVDTLTKGSTSNWGAYFRSNPVFFGGGATIPSGSTMTYNAGSSLTHAGTATFTGTNSFGGSSAFTTAPTFNVGFNLLNAASFTNFNSSAGQTLIQGSTSGEGGLWVYNPTDASGSDSFLRVATGANVTGPIERFLCLVAARPGQRCHTVRLSERDPIVIRCKVEVECHLDDYELCFHATQTEPSACATVLSRRQDVAAFATDCSTFDLPDCGCSRAAHVQQYRRI